MSKTTLIWIAIVVIVVLAGIAWKVQKGDVPFYSRSGFQYGSESFDDTMVGPEQGVDDIAAEAATAATLDSSMDSDLQQLDKELQGI